MRSTTGSLMRAGGCVRARERLCSTWGSSGSASCNRFFHCLTHPSDMPTAWAYCCCEKSRVQSHQPTQIGSRCIVYYFHNGTSWLYRLNICQQCTVPAPRFARLRCYYTLSVTRLLPHTGGCGAGWGPGACPGGNAIPWGLRGANRSHPNQDKHQAPSSTPPRPLSLQAPGPQAPQWIGFPDSVVTIHEGRGRLMPKLEHKIKSAQSLPCA